MNLEQLNKKLGRYDMAIESIAELIENGDVSESYIIIKEDLKSKRSLAESDFLQQRKINEMQVKGVNCVTGNQ